MGNIKRGKAWNKWGDDYRVLVRVPHPFGGPLGPVPRPETKMNSSSTCRCSPRPKSEAHLSDSARQFVACLSAIFIRFQFSSKFHSNSSIHFEFKWNPIDIFVFWIIQPLNYAIKRVKKFNFNQISWLWKGKRGKFLSCQWQTANGRSTDSSVWTVAALHLTTSLLHVDISISKNNSIIQQN